MDLPPADNMQQRAFEYMHDRAGVALGEIAEALRVRNDAARNTLNRLRYRRKLIDAVSSNGDVIYFVVRGALWPDDRRGPIRSAEQGRALQAKRFAKA